MNQDQREIHRKLRTLRYADEIGHVAGACRYFGIARSTFCRWREAYQKHGEAGLVNAKPIPKRHANQTVSEVEEKVLHYNFSRPHGAHAGKSPYEALRDKLRYQSQCTTNKLRVTC